MSEFSGVKHFGKYIGNVVVSVDIRECYFLRLNMLVKEMVFNIDVFDAVMEKRILR